MNDKGRWSRCTNKGTHIRKTGRWNSRSQLAQTLPKSSHKYFKKRRFNKRLTGGGLWRPKSALPVPHSCTTGHHKNIKIPPLFSRTSRPRNTFLTSSLNLRVHCIHWSSMSMKICGVRRTQMSFFDAPCDHWGNGAQKKCKNKNL